MARDALDLNVHDARAAAGMDQSAGSAQAVPAKLRIVPSFEPCPIDAGDEVFCNGIFEFNITRLTAFVAAHPDRFPIEAITVASTPNYGDSRLDQSTIAVADLSRPVLFAEIAPGRFNLIDGNHRMAQSSAQRRPHRARPPDPLPTSRGISHLADGLSEVRGVLEREDR